MKAPLRIAAAITLLGVCQAHAETIERRTDAAPNGEVEIVNVEGDIHVMGWEKSEVQVKAELGRGVERLDVMRDGDHILVKVVLKSGNWRSSRTELEIHVPNASRLDTNTVSADQRIEGVHGALRLQSVSGSIEADVWDNNFEAKTVSGSVHAEGMDGKHKGGPGLTRVTTVSGEIEIEDLGSELELRSVSGNINVEGSELKRASMKTTNGDMQLSASLARDAKIEVETINGEVRFEIEGTVNAEFDVETFNGDIENCIGPKPKRTSEYAPGKQLRFKEGDGQARVRIKTLNGAVSVCHDKDR